MPTASSLAWKTSPKVRTLWHCRLWAWRFTYDWSWWYPSGNRPLQQYLGFTAGRWLWLPEHKADSLIAKFKEAGGTVREIDVWAESPRLSPLWLSASSSACHGLLIITVITLISQSPARQNARELVGERGNYWHAQQRDVAALDAKYTKELGWMLKLKMMLCVMMLPLSSSVAHQQSASVREATTASGVDNAASTGRHRWTGYFTLRERLITMQNNWKEPRSILMR